ncbi:MAG: Fic family protein [Candidatus Cloacimonetes bacterium]|nr:Fic family protein [Candidatus Cloacimonadota bacterium]MDD4157382.1 Fic family protein [Candidatus Cloacimonadota bacterium]
MFLLDIENIRIDRNYLTMLEDKKKKLFRFLIYEKKYNNLRLFRTYLKSLLRLQDLMNMKSAQFEANTKTQAEHYLKNLNKAFGYIIDEVIDNKIPKDHKDLIYLHYVVDPEAHKKHPGSYRHNLIKVGKHDAPEPARVFSLVENMFYNGAEISNAIIKAIYYHHELVRIHPFADANGRVARLMENWILMHDLYPPIIISSVKERQSYIRDLEKSFEDLEKTPGITNDATTNFFNNQLKRLNNSLDYLYTRLKL